MRSVVAGSSALVSSPQQLPNLHLQILAFDHYMAMNNSEALKEENRRLS